MRKDSQTPQGERQLWDKEHRWSLFFISLLSMPTKADFTKVLVLNCLLSNLLLLEECHVNGFCFGIWAWIQKSPHGKNWKTVSWFSLGVVWNWYSSRSLSPDKQPVWQGGPSAQFFLTAESESKTEVICFFPLSLLSRIQSPLERFWPLVKTEQSLYLYLTEKGSVYGPPCNSCIEHCGVLGSRAQLWVLVRDLVWNPQQVTRPFQMKGATVSLFLSWSLKVWDKDHHFNKWEFEANSVLDTVIQMECL